MCNNANVRVLFEEGYEVTEGSDRFYSSHWMVRVVEIATEEFHGGRVIIAEEEIEVIDNTNEDNCCDRSDQRLLRYLTASQVIRWGVERADKLIREFSGEIETITNEVKNDGQ